MSVSRWKSQGTARQPRALFRVLRGLAVASLAVAMAVPGYARSDEKEKEEKKEAERALIAQLLNDIEELKARVHELEEKQRITAEKEVTKAATTPAGPASASIGTSSALTPTVAQPQPVTSSVPAASSAAPPERAAIPPQGDSQGFGGVQLKLFGDVGYHATDLHGDTNTFYLGSLDMFMTGRLTDRVSILSEVLFVAGTDNSIGVDVERLLLQYKQNDYFKLGVGRYHTAIGYYNPIFHRGAWFQTTIGRPFMYEYDDNGGFLPLQDVGVTVSGKLPGEKLGLQYTADVGNGRAHVLGSDPAQNRQDTNNGKMVTFALTSRPSALPGWQAGFSITHDYLTFNDSIDHPELITTAHLVYTTSVYEFLNEVMLVRHKYSGSGAPGVFHTPGFYTQFSRRFGKFRPYFRYSYINAQNDEPIYGDPTDGDIVGRRNGPSVGVRWDFNEHSAVKLQYDRTAIRETGLNTSYNEIAIEFSFAF